MDFYPLFVFEVDNLPSSIKSVDDAVAVVKRLRKEEDHRADFPPDPRFIRLGKRLAQEFPDEEKNFWLNRPEFDLPASKRIWQPELLGTDRVQRLLKVLLPLARGLHLGVFDAMFGIYIPPGIKEQPLPKGKEAVEYRAEFDEGFLQWVKAIQAGGIGETGQWTRDAVDKYVEETLTPVLVKHGFIPKYSRCFQRAIGGGYQEITSVAMSSSFVMPTICSVDFEQHSERMLAIKTQYNNFGSDMPEPKYIHNQLSKIFYLGLPDFRKIAQPGWRDRGTWAVELALSQEDVDWIIEDILQMGLPLLDRLHALSVDGADRFFNEPNEFTGELFRESGGSYSKIINATVYARLAGKRDFEAVVRRFEQFMDTHERYSGVKKEYAQVVEICRKHLQPVEGSEPA